MGRTKIDSDRQANRSGEARDADFRGDAGRHLTVDDIRRSIEEGRVRGSGSPADEVFGRVEAKLRAFADPAL